MALSSPAVRAFFLLLAGHFGAFLFEVGFDASFRAGGG